LPLTFRGQEGNSRGANSDSLASHLFLAQQLKEWIFLLHKGKQPKIFLHIVPPKIFLHIVLYGLV